MTNKKTQRAGEAGRKSKRYRTASQVRAERKAANSVRGKREFTERHLGMPWEEWRTKKRGEWQQLMHALDRFKYGSAYTPAGHDLWEIDRAAQRIKESMECDWVSW